MLIRCKIERKGGSLVHLDDDAYQFLPDPKSGEHVCDVRKNKHIKTLLAIPEGYEPAGLGEDDDDDGDDDADRAPVKLDADNEQGDLPPLKAPKIDAPDRSHPELEDLDDDALASKHEEVMGKAPRKGTKRDTIIDRIRDELETREAAGV